MQLPTPAVAPPLDPRFRPAALANRALRQAAEAAGKSAPLAIALERGDGSISTYRTTAVAPGGPQHEANLEYAERIVKTLLWQRGGWRVIIGGPDGIGEHIRQVYSPSGPRAFDHEFMGGVYEKPFTVDVTDADRVPDTQEATAPLGRHLEGCRIGFDLGASDYKIAAVIDGESVFSDEIVWHPREQTDPDYHYEKIMEGLKMAMAHLPRVDAIGGSSAGVYINNRVRVASLFRGIPKDLFDAKIAGMFVRIGQELGVPLEVINDGEVTALAGSMSLEDNPVLGIAMGSSEAGGYVTPEGNVTGWLNELAFVPFDYQPEAAVDEWSGDRGVGSQYLCQTGVIRLAPAAGIDLSAWATPAEKLKAVQDLMAAGDERVPPIYESIGSYLGYAIAHYADFYELKHVLVLGRVTSGAGGQLIIDRANRVLGEEFPELAARITVSLPDERSRRVGQAIAAASLPAIG
ncbi:MAG TPA: ROK family protein [Armatimonadota bacterium]|nr:ROK family protein [Armatimonadota bacterium]HQK94422.1 ROK family protein [Armatimonadota bacterium]